MLSTDYYVSLWFVFFLIGLGITNTLLSILFLIVTFKWLFVVFFIASVAGTIWGFFKLHQFNKMVDERSRRNICSNF